jgi:PIN domain nuclease of toxin-antitoxin system
MLARDFEGIIAAQGFDELAISMTHARLAGQMNIAHKDPFDRLLIAQAQAEDMVLISNEALFDGFAVQRLW